MIYRSLVSFGRYTPKYFILFVAMVNGIVSLISLSAFLTNCRITEAEDKISEIEDRIVEIYESERKKRKTN